MIHLILFCKSVLDVDLGKPDKSGLHILQEIRSRDPFVPVIVMNSFDDAEVCQVALELQADAFIAKQLNDKTNWTSLDYYRKFVEMIELVLNASAADRDLFRKFIERSAVIIKNDQAAKAAGHFQRLEDGVLGELTKFFLLLRVANRHHLFQHLLSNTLLKDRRESYDELMLVLLDAILAWLNWDRPFGSTKIEGFIDWFKSRRTSPILAQFWLDANGTLNQNA